MLTVLPAVFVILLTWPDWNQSLPAFGLVFLILLSINSFHYDSDLKSADKNQQLVNSANQQWEKHLQNSHKLMSSEYLKALLEERRKKYADKSKSLKKPRLP